MILKLFVICSLWKLSVVADFGMFEMGAGMLPVQRSVFDSSTFTDQILGCHADCGDEYYSCSFVKCGTEIKHHFTAEGELDSEKTSYKRMHPSLWSRFLYFFSFGFLGSLSYIEKASLVELERPSPDMNSHTKSEPVCLKNCTSLFRECYHKCICDANPTEARCMQAVIVYPQTYAPIQKDSFGQIVVNRNNDQKTYSFDWNKFL